MRDKLAESIEASTVVADYLGVLQGSFYSDSKPFFQQKRQLIRCITLLARWFDKRGMWISEASYRDKLDAIILDIKRFGSTSKITYFPAYFQHIVQEYIKHHDEELMREGKSARDAIIDARDVINSLRVKDAQTMDVLSAFHSLTKSGPKPKKPKSPKPKPSDQLSFGL